MLMKADDNKQASKETTRHPRAAFIRNIFVRGAFQLLLMAIVLGLSFAVTMMLVRSKPEVPRRPVFPSVYTVDTLMAESGTYQPVLSLYGEVVAGRSVELRSLVSGPIIAVNDKLKSGGAVSAGDVLVEIDPFDYEGALREARANGTEIQAKISEANAMVKLEQSRLQSARDQLELASSDLKRIEDLRATGAANQKQVDERKLVLSQREQAVEQSEINIIAENARIEQLRANMERLDWKILQSGRNLSNTRLTAPFSGTIRSSSAEVGKLANVNDILVSMYQTDSLEARFVLTDARFGRLQSEPGGIVGRDLEVIWNVGGTDYTYPAKIDRIGAEIASTSGGVEIFATIDGSGNALAMRPGAFVEIRLPDRSFVAHFSLPGSSLYNTDTVYVVENGELVERTVTIAAYDGDNVLVSSGINPGDEILVTRISEISPGLKVRKEGDPIPVPGKPAKSSDTGKNDE